MPPLPSAWLRQQTIIWMGNLLTSIPHLCSASILFCEGEDLDLLRDLVIFFYPCIFNLSIPSSCFSSAQCFPSQTTDTFFNPPLYVVSLRQSVLSWSSSSFLVFSFHSSICSAKASSLHSERTPGKSMAVQWLRPHFFTAVSPGFNP